MNTISFSHSWQPLKICVTRLRVEDVRNISDKDVKAEGFDSYGEFIGVWCMLHHQRMVAKMNICNRDRATVSRDFFQHAPSENYKAVVLDFTLKPEKAVAD